MKKVFSLIVFLLVLALLGGCADTIPPEASGDTQSTAPSDTQMPSQTEPARESFVFTRENFPRMDGSTSMVPLGQAVACVLLGESREEVSDLTRFNRTTQSFRNLMNGNADILIVGEPNASVYTEMETVGFEAEIRAIATDALIFVVNEDNPVDNLTTEQLRMIYSGEITNWKEVGGNDAPIEAFQRNEDAGSQSLMKKLVMQDTPLMEAPAAYTIDSMMGLMETVKNYDNSSNAIGYSVFYYANDMQMAQGLKILSIDGVMPSAETIRSGEYPHLNAYYCVIPASAPVGSPNRVLFDWLLSVEGQQLVAMEGYVSILDPDETVAPIGQEG